jgi:hypothetical protein
MPFQFVNSIASWLLKKRIHQIELFVKYPFEVQEEVLHDLLYTAQDTVYGRTYDFKSIDNYATFAARVPLSHYEDLAEDIEKSRQGMQNIFWPTPIKWFAKSSGTTNAKSKFIPVSNESLEHCHYEASKDLLSLYLNNNPESNLFVGKSLRLGGSKELYRDKDTFFGDLSAILIDNMPIWAEFSSTPSSKISLMGDWETKMPAIIEASINENVTNLAGVPSWMMVLLQKTLDMTAKSNVLDIWPNAEVYFHGGVSFEPYKEQYKKLFPSSKFQYYEIYNASEGFFAIQDRNNSDELLLMLDYGIFYEFIPMDLFGTSEQIAVPLHEVEINKNYALVISTNAGLWRYIIGDTVRFTSTNPYRIKVTGRTKHHINVFGEELMIENTDKALAETCAAFGCEVLDYTVAPIFMSDKQKGAHEWLVEFKQPPEDLTLFAQALDLNIQNINSDYEAKRYNNMTLNPLVLHVAKTNLFYDWLKSKDKLGGQNKVPRLSNSREFLEELMGLAIKP